MNNVQNNNLTQTFYVLYTFSRKYSTTYLVGPIMCYSMLSMY
jgi:hypothetical protein